MKWSAKAAVAKWLRFQVLSMEVSDSNPDNF